MMQETYELISKGLLEDLKSSLPAGDSLGVRGLSLSKLFLALIRIGENRCKASYVPSSSHKGYNPFRRDTHNGFNQSNYYPNNPSLSHHIIHYPELLPRTLSSPLPANSISPTTPPPPKKVGDPDLSSHVWFGPELL